MKYIFTFLIFTVFSFSAFTQTAVNFTCNDCAGNSHDLFSELDQGNVIVLCWVMPCAGCVGPSYTTYSEVQSFESSFPGRVHMYICDDEGTLNCPQLVDWCLNNNMLKTTRFSDTLIRMSDYGSSGMPKIVVLGGGTNHHVYFIANDSVNNVALHDSINSALIFDQGIYPNNINRLKGRLVPNPATVSSSLFLDVDVKGDYQVNLFDCSGKFISTLFNATLGKGEHVIEIKTSELTKAEYLIKVSGNKEVVGIFKLLVVNRD